MADPLAGVRAKLDRAETHLKALQDEAAVFLDSDAYGVREHFHPDGRHYSLSIEVRREPPLILSVILGDFIHNLRSALDHLAWQLVLANDGTPTKATQFPIFTSPPVSGDALRKWTGNVEGMTAPVIDEIRGIQPHTAGNQAHLHSLAILASLSNEDKHRLPVACVAAIAKHDPGKVGLMAVRDIEIKWAGIATGKPLVHGDHIAWADVRTTGPQPEIEMKGKLPVEIAFGDAQARLDGLVDICRQVRSIVPLMEAVAFPEPPHNSPPVG